jgi:hypothetical protein
MIQIKWHRGRHWKFKFTLAARLLLIIPYFRCCWYPSMVNLVLGIVLCLFSRYTLARYRFLTTAAPPRGGIAQLSVSVFKIPPVLICNITHKNTGIFEIFAFKCTINHANNNLRLSVD